MFSPLEVECFLFIRRINMKEKVELIKSSLDTDLDNIDNINTFL